MKVRMVHCVGIKTNCEKQCLKDDKADFNSISMA